MTEEVMAGAEPRLVWASGPLRVRVEKGGVRLLEAEYSEGEEVVIHRDRSYILEIMPHSSIVVEGAWGALREPTREEIGVYTDWKAKVEELARGCLRESRCTVAVLGPTDVGKTSFITMLANRMLGESMVNIMDTDLGQSTIGVPGFIALAQVRQRLLWNRAPRYSRLFFVGSITPVGSEGQVVSAAASLAGNVTEGPLLVDTDGWFTGLRAVKYKLELIRSLRADHVVIIGGGENEVRALSKTLGSRMSLLAPPPNRVLRSGRERRMLRGDKMLLVEGMERILVNPADTPLIGSITLGLGDPLGEEELDRISKETGARPVYGEQLDKKTLLVTKNRPRTRPEPSRVVIPLDDVRGLLLSLVDKTGGDYSYGILTGADESRRSLVLQVPSGAPRPHLVRTGYARFDGESIIMDNRIRLLQKIIERER